MANPFDQFDGSQQGFTPLTAPDPTKPVDLSIKQGDLARQPYLTSSAQANAARAQAEARYAGDTAKAQRDKAVADALVAQQNAAGATAGSLNPNSNVHGDDYLKNLPAGLAATVKAVATGNVMLPPNALKVPYWQQVLQHTLNYDPSFNAADYNTRARTRADFATGKMGLNITALNTALGHAGQLQDDASALGNYGGIIGTSIVNPVKNLWGRLSGDPTATNFANDARAYGGEKTAVFAGGSGGEGERQAAERSVPLNGSPDQQIGVLSHDAELFKSRLDALNDQYKRGMGRTADITDLLNPHAREVYQQLLANAGQGPTGAAYAPGVGVPPAPGAPPGAPPSGPAGGGIPPGWTGPSSGPQQTIATGPTRNVPLNHVNDIINQMVRSGASSQDIGNALSPYGFGAPSDEQVQAARDYLKRNPGYKGSFGGLTQAVPTTTLQRLAGSGVGAFTAGVANSATAGAIPAVAGATSFLEGNGYSAGRDQYKVNQALMADAHPGASLAGNMVGGAASMAGLEAGAAKYGLGKLAVPAAEAGYGAVSGYNDGGVGGAITGAIAGPVAGMFGRKVIAPIIRPATTLLGNGIRAVAPSIADKLGIAAQVAAPSAADATVVNAANKAGIPDILQQLSEAKNLGVPMALADTNTGLRSLAGAAVRRSPNAAQVAEDALLPRARGQIDRFGSAVNRDLGPIANIPQVSADLTSQARAAAAPLYDAAYNAPGASSVDLTDLAERPSMKAALSRAYGIAKEEGRDPTTLGFGLNDQGEVTLNRAPSFQTLDYVKRGLDDTLEPHRNAITGKLNLNEATAAINKTKADLLGRIDAVNPDYAAARSAYAGPVQARDALARGQDAFSLSPDELGMQVQGQSPEHLAQMQLGYRSELMNRANNVRDVSNPFEATLGTPNARARIDAIYPNNPGTPNLMRTRDLESQLARTNTDVLGNSKTAERTIADKVFAGGGLPSLAVDATLAAHGAAPVSSIARVLGTHGLKDLATLGIGKRAVQKADALAPILLNTNPGEAISTLQGLSANSAAYRDYVNNLLSRKISGMFAARAGSSGALALLPPGK